MYYLLHAINFSLALLCILPVIVMNWAAEEGMKWKERASDS
jgi:hypothetical protein